MNTTPNRTGFWKTAWTYQRERFPLAAHGPLIAAFSACAVSYAALLRHDEPQPPAWPAFVIAFVVCLGFFFQLRVADEFKDAEEDARWRPYRPVPRGLVTLRSLALAGVAVAILQAALTLLWSPVLGLWLLLVWTYFTLMSIEFGIGRWLRARPLTYMLSHLFIMPLIDFYGTACDWVHVSGAMPDGLACFVAASYFNGIVIEMGRKIRAPADEELGVGTYTAIWGARIATTGWLAALVAAALCGWLGARIVGAGTSFACVAGAGIALAAISVRRFRARPQAGAGKLIERVSGIWTLMLYLGLGLLPRI